MILGVTPVRGGSKGIPGKNLRDLCGRPLLAWTVEAAQSSRLVDRYVVSTEDAAIGDVAHRLGVEVLERPQALATDHALTAPVLRQVLDCIPADVVVLLQATSPVRAPDLIDGCIRRFLESGADSLATGYICRAVEFGPSGGRRQDVEGFFVDDGNVYIATADLVRSGSLYGGKVERVVIDRAQNIDIDDEFDLWLAAQVLMHRGAPSVEAP